MFRTDYSKWSDSHTALALEALRRTAGEPVTLDQVKSLLIELLQHPAECDCGNCYFVNPCLGCRMT